MPLVRGGWTFWPHGKNNGPHFGPIFSQIKKPRFSHKGKKRICCLHAVTLAKKKNCCFIDTRFDIGALEHNIFYVKRDNGGIM